MKNKLALFILCMSGTLYGQKCDLPVYKLRAGIGEELKLHYSAIYHLGGRDCSTFGGRLTVCHSGLAFGMMPGTHKKETQLDNKVYEFRKSNCSKYSISYPVDTFYRLDTLDTTRFSAYKGHSRDLDYLSLNFMTSVMDISLLFDRDTMILMSISAPAYGEYNKELLHALTNEFNFRYGLPIDSLKNGKTINPDYIRNVYTWSTIFCKQQKTIRIQQVYNIKEKTGEEILIEFASEKFKLN